VSLIPNWFGSKTLGLDKFFGNIDELFSNKNSGLSVYDDEKNVFVEAHVPGLTAKEVTVSIDDEGVLWIKGEKQAEERDQKKHYYKKSQCSFSYAVPLKGEIDDTVEPKAKVKDGVMSITFAKKKSEKRNSKKIRVEGE